MNAVLLLTAGFVSVAVVGTLAAALHDAAVALLRQRGGLPGRNRIAGSSGSRALPPASWVMTDNCQQRAPMTGAVPTGPVCVRLCTPTSSAGRLGSGGEYGGRASGIGSLRAGGGRR